MNPTGTPITPLTARGAPRWMWTFADLMSLLFTLFVMLLTFADFNPGKFDSTMGPVRQAFNEYAKEPSKTRKTTTTSPRTTQSYEELARLEQVREYTRIKNQTVDRLWRQLNAELVTGLLSLEETENGVILRFPSSTAFSSGGADLRPEMRQTLDRVADVLRSVSGTIAVTGHTDNVPIETERFRSNWDLSTARAVSVVHNLLDAKLDPSRIAATGYADTRPLAPNDSEDNRALNRRVQIEVTITKAVPVVVSGHGTRNPLTSSGRDPIWIE